MGRVLDKLLNWYFSKNSLPYWCVLLADSAICYLSGIIVFWFYYRGAVTLGNIALLSKTIAIYMVFNLIGFRVFRTYSGILRYSSFVDLQRVALA
ncbi:MAG: polysaccharide biosynthesis protein, partial [Prevotellaceae bacterium]|nr:polysaccharide biosynthesis protein [Prevotellaceae bacterium]